MTHLDSMLFPAYFARRLYISLCITILCSTEKWSLILHPRKWLSASLLPDLLDNPCTVSAAPVWNSASCNTHVYRLTTDSDLLFSNIQRYRANIDSGSFLWNFVYRDPSPSSWCWPASLRLIRAISNKSANCSMSLALPVRTCRNCSNSSK